MQLTDHSGLRRHGAAATEPIEIPLNGQVYYALPEVPVHTVMAAIGQSQKMEDIAADLERAGISDLADSEALERMAAENPALAIKVSVAGMSRAERAVRFMQECLVAESLERWAHFMWPMNPEWPEAVQAEHEKAKITLPQLLAVFQDLISYYNGGRPTEPSSPNTPGHDGTGGPSTAPASIEEGTMTPWTSPPIGS
jgi:hypothetical protein